MARTLTDAEALRDGRFEPRDVGGDLHRLEGLGLHDSEWEAVVMRGAESVQRRDSLRAEAQADSTAHGQRSREQSESVLELAPAGRGAWVARSVDVVALALRGEVDEHLRRHGGVAARRQADRVGDRGV